MALGKRCRRRPLALAALLAPAALAQRPLDWREDSCGEALRACQWSTGLRLLPAAEAAWSRRQLGDFCGDEGCARWMEASRGLEDESCGFRGAARLAEALERACDAVEDEVKAERRMAQEADAGSDDGGDSASSGGGGSGSGSSNFSSGSHGSESHLGTAGSTLKGYEKTSATTQSTPAELAMSYLYISLILALFNCSYLFFMRKT